MRKLMMLLGALCAVVFLALSCSYRQPDYSDTWDLTERTRDSLRFSQAHHYSDNYNFLVVGDSLVLQVARPLHNRPCDEQGERLCVWRDERLVVADIVILPEDSIDSVWVQVARDQYTFGWVHERELLEQVAPDDPISLFIHVFSDEHLFYFLALLSLLCVVLLGRRLARKRFRIVHFDDIGSGYPTSLCICFSLSAVLYAGIQRFAPDMWAEFYFHPTLNPLLLPPVLGAFIGSVWLALILALASAEEAFRQLSWSEACVYLLALAGVCVVCYLFFTLAAFCYVGYPVWVLYTVFAVWRYRRYGRCAFLCGRCGARLRRKGRCPKCGAWNE